MYEEETRSVKGLIVWFVALCFIISGFIWLIERPAKIAEKVIDDSLVSYEEFQEIYNTCQKLDADLATVGSIDEHDKMFDSFSKASLIAAKRQQMTRWIGEYNAKSKMWNRAIWKSNALPYQLSTSNFPHYGDSK